MHPKVLLEACTELVALTLKFEHPADAVVARFFRQNRGLGPRERQSLSDTVFAVLRYKLRFEHLAPSGSGPKERRLAILGFAQGVGARDYLKGALTDREKDWLDQCDAVRAEDLLERHRHNLPEWLATALKAQLGDGFWPLVQSLEQGAALDLRVNLAKGKREEVLRRLADAGVKASPTPYSPWGLRLADKPGLQGLDVYREGLIEVQDEGSQMLALLLDARRGEMVADFCAGAGGKTLAIGACMRNTGRLYAFDTSAHRLDALGPRLARSGLSNVHPAAIAPERDDRIKRLAGKMDRVLVDAPCSGLGTLRRNPDLKWRQTPQSVAALAVTQGAILASAARLVKPGGRLVYATCSLLADENEAVATAFSAAQQRDFVPLDVATVLNGLKVQTHAGTPQALCHNGFLRLWPHQHATDGFFAAVWERH